MATYALNRGESLIDSLQPRQKWLQLVDRGQFSPGLDGSLEPLLVVQGRVRRFQLLQLVSHEIVIVTRRSEDVVSERSHETSSRLFAIFFQGTVPGTIRIMALYGMSYHTRRAPGETTESSRAQKRKRNRAAV